jgi:hypothetical protein
LDADWKDLYPMTNVPNLLQWQVYKYILDNVESINDHKGELEIILKSKINKELIYNIFMVFWELENELNISMYFKNKCIYGNQLRNNK